MISRPKITVYITNYNYGQFLRQAIESVLIQTEQDFEIILIDDGSTDDSVSLIQSYIDHPKIKIVLQQNKGLTISNNLALKLSRGKYIMRLDADDYLAENALEKAGMTVNKNMVPFDERSPLVTSGIRVGTPAVTTRGMGVEEMQAIAEMINRVISSHDDENLISQVKGEVGELCSGFPLYADLLD